jgi:two-component system response regulator HydG
MANILLIDDMKGVRQALAAVLKRAGHTITEADDGKVALEILKTDRRFDLVITDILMPTTDGIEVVMYLDSLPHRPPVLAISGGGSQIPADSALVLVKTKADAALAKPFDNSELLAAVDKLLRPRK